MPSELRYLLSDEPEEPIIEIDHVVGSAGNIAPVNKPSLFLYFSALVALLNAFSFGLVGGYYSAAIDSMRNSTFIEISWDDDKSSWVAATLPIGALVGGLFAGPLATFTGPKMALILNNVPYVAGWALIIFGRQFLDIIIGRVLGGIAVGISCGVVPVYCVEISTQAVRGLLGMSFQLFVNTGIFVCWVAGNFLDYRWLGGLSAIVSITMPILMLCCPESPVYLAKKGFEQRTEVLSCLRKLRSTDSAIESEYENLEFQARTNQNNQEGDAGGCLTVIRNFLTLPQYYKPLLLSFTLMFFQQLCGINAVVMYQLDIFAQAGSTLAPHTCSIILGGVLIVATLTGSLIVDKFGRKVLLFLSGIGMTLALIPLAIYFQVIDSETPTSASTTSIEFGWVALASLVLFLAAFSVAYGPVPWVMVPEITPSAARSVVTALATCFTWSLAFIIIKWFPTFELLVGKALAFYTFAALSALSCAFVVFMLPETKGKSLYELEDLFVERSDGYEQTI